MKTIKLREELSELKNVHNSLEKALKTVPEGNLRISQHGKKFQYYLITRHGDSHGSYIRSDQHSLVEKLAQKSYSIQLLKKVDQHIKAIERFLKVYDDDVLGTIYDKLSPQRKGLVTPIFLSDPEYIKKWSSEQFMQNPYDPESKSYATRRGDFVRSKSEAIIADIYYELEIPYRYECELILPDGRKKYPDFTVLDVANRRIIYHEHMGLLEDEQYRRQNLIKLNDYARFGISTGKNLLLTFETSYCPFNVQLIRKQIQDMLF